MTTHKDESMTKNYFAISALTVLMASCASAPVAKKNDLLSATLVSQCGKVRAFVFTYQDGHVVGVDQTEGHEQFPTLNGALDEYKRAAVQKHLPATCTVPSQEGGIL